MNTKLLDSIARAVLYEGYMLYPYRPSSVKNRQRFNFGVLYPRAYSRAQTGSDAWSTQTECLVQGGPATAVEARLRFLKLVVRSVRNHGNPSHENAESDSLPREAPAAIHGAAPAWQEAIECEVAVPPCSLEGLAAAPVKWKFEFPAKEDAEESASDNPQQAGVIERKQEEIQGVVEIDALPLTERLYKLRVVAKNLTHIEAASGESGETGRNAALMRSLVSAHAVLGVVEGEFVSLLEPPESLKEQAASCENIGVWPVLIGANGESDTVLASPIILYDYPQIAPESPGDLFDGTEIDEILALRILTLTEDEKREMRNTDERARKILERTESLPLEHLAKLHGTLRELRSLKEETP